VNIVLGVGWMSPDEIKMPARPVPQDNHTRGLRDKYEQKTLRQKYASDDTNVPEYAVQRVNEYGPISCKASLSHADHCAPGVISISGCLSCSMFKIMEPVRFQMMLSSCLRLQLDGTRGWRCFKGRGDETIDRTK
jgi:hypothetical protein